MSTKSVFHSVYGLFMWKIKVLMKFLSKWTIYLSNCEEVQFIADYYFENEMSVGYKYHKLLTGLHWCILRTNVTS